MKDSENTIKISKIEIKIGKQVISLTPDELKELKEVLEKVFPTEEIIKWIPSQPVYIPFPIERQLPPQPYYTSPTIGDPVPPYWTITCGNQTIGYNEAAETMRLIF